MYYEDILRLLMYVLCAIIIIIASSYGMMYFATLMGAGIHIQNVAILVGGIISFVPSYFLIVELMYSN
jgi:hypothetical protein